MARDLETDKENGQAHVPKPPSREEIEEISRAQQFITDDWTGDGGTSAGRTADRPADAAVDSCDSGDKSEQ